MLDLNLSQNFTGALSPDRRPHPFAYALPTLFTAGGIFAGFASIQQSIQGAMMAYKDTPGAEHHFGMAAKTIGVAFLLDGLDGRIARATNTASDFGREMDSFADVIAFGIAPAVLAFTWGVQFVDLNLNVNLHNHILSAGWFVAFMFLLCALVRHARFLIQNGPTAKNSSSPNRNYFAGLPIPAAAGMVAAVVHAWDSAPLTSWPLTLGWLALLVLLSLLMVSTWRYYSFKDINLMRPWTVILAATLIYVIWNYSRPVLITCAMGYILSGITAHLAAMLRRESTPPSL
jgi:CDP-diacylglycerol--serine O-phosphatidyltransferase